ncbi:50S ribosomal protein L22 [Patescibacteria group bacterium]|nr:50S ribosomal protein L22 [Patescibacteria group bacterium]
MEVKAKLSRLKIAPRKVRLVINVVKGMDVEKAEHQLQFMQKGAVAPVLKLLKSAIANAVNNSKLEKNNLYIKEITANDGPVLKRWKPRAFGRATEILKRSSHVEIVLGELKESKPVAKDAKKKDAKDQKEELKVVDANEIRKETQGEQGREEKGETKDKKSGRRFKGMKDAFIHRTGDK